MIWYTWVWVDLLYGKERSVWADKGYVSAEREAAFSKDGKVWGLIRKAPKGRKLGSFDEEINRVIALVRAKVEHPLRVIKRQFGHVKAVIAAWPRTGVTVHAVRARQSVPGPTKAAGTRTSPPKIYQTAVQAEQNPRNQSPIARSCKVRPLSAADAIDQAFLMGSKAELFVL